MREENNYGNKFNTMKGEILKAIRERLPESFEIEEVKNIKNGQIYEGFSLRKNNENIAPCFYFNNFFEAYEDGVSIELIVDRIITIYNETLNERNRIKTINFEDFEQQKNKIIYKIINTERNKTTISNSPSFSFCDLSIIFSLLVEINESYSEVGTIRITNEMMKLWGVNKETLLKYASINTPKLLPADIGYVSEYLMIQESNERDFDEMLDLIDFNSFSNLLYLKNKQQTNGFATIIYPNVLEKLQNKMGSFYILPSSIHEALILPFNEDIDKNYLKEMVHEVNSTIVDPLEFLSDSVYFYNAETKNIEMY